MPSEATIQPEESPTAQEPVRLRFQRRWTEADRSPFEQIEWTTRETQIRGEAGPVFEQSGVEVPAAWSQDATNVVASKYFRGALGSPDRERSVRQLISRVADSIVAWGRDDGYFASRADADTFGDELAYLLLHQRASFNSPVWFNVGVEASPQCSACFINSVEDSMASILDLAKTEGLLFKYGSGSGTNLSSLRGSQEPLSSGGTASGPISFMRGFDAFAGAIKSGGKTRRAAKMVILDDDHPDIEAFAQCKAREEEKARALVAAGYDPGFDVAGGAYDTVAFQNANHSIRLSDEFLQAVEEDRSWTTRSVRDGTALESQPARRLFRSIAQAAWSCGDPGIQYRDTIQGWHTCATSGPIRASNPCSEYLFLDDSACNLASLNLLRFHDPEQGFDSVGFVHACEILLTAQEILVDRASYPTPAIERNSKRFRPLGLGYANLGALLMANGLPYDSAEGRTYAAAITALLTGAAYRCSARLARVRGPFDAFGENRDSLLGVLRRHREALHQLEAAPTDLSRPASELWDEALREAEETGVRNAQVTVLAPTGTIAFMMDCDTTGVEPEIALVRHKRLAGGGTLRLVNRTVPLALARLGYGPDQVGEITEWADQQGTVEGAPGLRNRDLPVFDCAFRPVNGSRSIGWSGHLKMLGALQPFLSGGISKTVNVDRETTVEEIEEIFLQAWRLGIKAVAVYRDGCKASQPLSGEAPPDTLAPTRSERRHLPDERQAITHKFSVGGHEGYLTVGLYENGQPGEIFLVMAKEGSTISGLVDAFSTAVSIALQYGVPLQTLIDKFSHTRFEPSGFTRNPEIPLAKSLTDYVFRWLAARFLDPDAQRAAGVVSPRTPADPAEVASPEAPATLDGTGTFLYQQDSPSCGSCGSIMVRSGSCYRCLTCGSTSGCS